MEKFTLTRTGDRPLSFTGERIASADGYLHGGQQQNRWHEIAVYATESGKFVGHVAYRTAWQGEDSHYLAFFSQHLADVVDELRAYDPTEFLVGFPPHENFADKQLRLIQSLRLRWASLLTDVFDELPDVAEEI